MLRWSAAPDVPARGRVLLIHGLSSLAQSWWRIGPELARRGWDVAAVDQAGHGGAPAPEQLSAGALASAVLEQHPDRPDVLIGHSLGTVTALALLERQPNWARVVILEDPPGVLLADGQDLAGAVAGTVRADAETVRRDQPALERRVRADCPHWADEDVHWAVEGIAQLDAEAFARWLDTLGGQGPEQLDVVQRIRTASPAPYVLAAVNGKGFISGGSALPDGDRALLQAELPAGHVVEIEGGHCLHRDAPTAWLAAVDEILSSEPALGSGLRSDG